MKKNMIVIAGVAVVVAVVGGIAATLLIGNKGASTDSAKEPAQDGFAAKVIEACDVLTVDIATTQLGETPTKESIPQTMEYSEDIAVSNCSYTTKFVVGQPDSLRSVSLFARSAKTTTGAEANETAVTGQAPTDAQTVDGYGDAAYWSPSLGQLNVLKSNNWYIFASGSSTDPTKRTLESAKKLADELLKKL